MINLFNIPNYIIDTSKFSNILHDKIVTEFEENFANYVGAKYACSVSSATMAIFLLLKDKGVTVSVPSMIPPVVLNAIITSGNKIEFVDNIDWVGNSYTLHRFFDYKIIDSAQRVDRDQFKNEATDNDLMVFSFYPTKPVGSCDGGMIVSNDKQKIDILKVLSFNGMSFSTNNWERKTILPGYKMYMNSIQAYIANENLKKLDEKKEKLKVIRDIYNTEFELQNTSDHLYRILIGDNKMFIDYMKKNGIVCGIHYEAMNLKPIYYNIGEVQTKCLQSEMKAKQTVSLPFHENLTKDDVYEVIYHINNMY